MDPLGPSELQLDSFLLFCEDALAIRESQNLIGIELGDTKEIGSLVNASTYSAVDAEIGLLLVSLLPSRFRVKQAQIELSRDDDRHRVVKDRIYHEYLNFR